jgi:hypothetical protein
LVDGDDDENDADDAEKKPDEQTTT